MIQMYSWSQTLPSLDMKQILDTAFVNHYETYKDKVYSYIFYRLDMDQALAEDLTSDTFIKAYEKFDTYDEQFAFSTWIYTIARNVMTDYFRTLSKQRNESLCEEDESEHFQSNDHVDDWNIALDTEASMKQVQEILTGLPEFQKDCVIMKYLDELSTKEIAHITDQNEASVRQALSRGIRKVRTVLKPLMTLLILLSPFFL